MTLAEIILIGLGLSMDAAAVSIANGLTYRNLKNSQKLSMALAFGVFQALMPMLGYWAGSLFADFISRYAGITAFIILGIIGGNMIKESGSRDEEHCCVADFSVRTMFTMAVATSIDALAIGVSFAFLDVNIWEAVLLIGLTTAIFSGAGVLIGNVFGSRFKSKAEFAGGFILVAMGLKILLEHTL